MITRSPSHPIPRPLGSPISSLHNQHYQYHHHHQQPTPSSATQSPASTIRSISRSPETNKYSSSSLMGDHYRIPITGGGGGASTSASSFYEGGTGSVYTSGYGGYSGTSRSSLGSSSALGAFEVEDSVVYLAHPVCLVDRFLPSFSPASRLPFLTSCSFSIYPADCARTDSIVFSIVCVTCLYPFFRPVVPANS